MREDDENINENIIEEQTNASVKEQELIEKNEEKSDSENQKHVGGNTASYKDLKFRFPKYPEK